MGTANTIETGAAAEQSVFEYLLAEGLQPISRNFRCRGGEIDLIMLHDDCLVFVEVRYRASSMFAAASSTVDGKKQRKLVRTAAMFVSRHSRHANRTMRFDVAAVEGSDDATITWIQDAFRPDGSSL